MNETCSKIAQRKSRLKALGIRNRALLAPMSGVTDVPFRQLAWRFGAGMVVSEMVASEALTTGQAEMRIKAESAGLPVHMVQLAGREVHWMAEATRVALGSGADIIDINMGCPSKRVTNGYSGSALMRDIDHALTLIEGVMEVSTVPVTLKMRLGWDEQSINAPELASRAEDAGVQLITVHGRTRNQFYKGEANWNLVRQVREVISVPLVVNGDIGCAETANEAFSASGADAVMIGRASYGAPWIVGQVAAELSNQTVSVVAPPTNDPHALQDLVIEHYEMMLSLYGTELGMRNARKHVDWYSNHLVMDDENRDLRKQFMATREPGEATRLLGALFAEPSPLHQAA
ncbi:MAG: tRNA dihydrouridine synthase DusB [Pseudomonadota bacterium]